MECNILNYQLITDNDALYALCQAVVPGTALALDTEFIRVRTYYPKLGLLQIYDGTNLALIDPLAITNWTPFIGLMSDASYIKYFHACSEDLDVFQHYFNSVPTAIIDTQILAAFLDNAVSTSYANLANKYMGICLNKNETRTNWLARPLSTEQCRYAAEDVYYLLTLGEQLRAEIKNSPWQEAAYEECRAIVAKKHDKILSENAYLNFKRLPQLRGKARRYLQLLAAWRLNMAREHDIAVNFVLPEIVLGNIAQYQPTSLAELQQLGMEGKKIRLYGQMILQIIKHPVTQDDVPGKHPAEYAEYKEIRDTLKQAVNVIATETGLNKEILLSRRHINHYVEWLYQPSTTLRPELICGWRAPLFKPYLPLHLKLNNN